MVATGRFTIALAGVLAAIGACAASQPTSSVRLVLEVAGERRRCTGEAVQQCLVVRRDADTTWGNFYDRIDGFTHEAGIRYRIEVERTMVAKPPADGSAYRYRLIRIISSSRDVL
ncbi:DUF4377 domain-containing protein [Gemmatimonas sp.]|uniref:DUF4377 domain-containing protein n=1 Tax=Gemmatimonas sp. TaxID=1962908 RepID=UPI00286D7048|nr:DUF4377 domain-containing protein [Gemmatimonas sp.]